jgi:hypothetical protein
VALDLAEMQLDAVTAGEPVAAALRLGLKPKGGIVLQGTGDISRGKDGDGASQPVTAAERLLVAQPVQADITQRHLAVALQPCQL